MGKSCAKCGKKFGLVFYGRFRYREWLFCSQIHKDQFLEDLVREYRVLNFLNWLSSKPP